MDIKQTSNQKPIPEDEWIFLETGNRIKEFFIDFYDYLTSDWRTGLSFVLGLAAVVTSLIGLFQTILR